METNVASPQTLTTKVVEAKTFFYNEGTTTLNKIYDYVNPAVEALMQEIEKRGLEPVGSLEFVYLNATGDMDKEFTLQIALPVKEQKPVGKEFHFKQAAPFKCVSYDYKGDVSKMFPTYVMLFQQIAANDLKPTIEVREVYKQWEHLTSPNNITEIQIGII